MTSTLGEPTRMALTTDHLRAMAEADLFDPNDRVELIGGEIYVTPPPSPEHTAVSLKLAKRLRPMVEPAISVERELPVELTVADLPTPDLCLFTGDPDDFDGYPPLEQVVGLIEIAVTSHAMDRGEKLARYARAGIGEYWVVDVPGPTVEVRTDPDGSVYRSVRLYGPDHVITSVAGTPVDLRVAQLFGPKLPSA